jgi:hypothetical protein
MLEPEIVNKLSAANPAFGFPNQERADGILTKNGIEQPTGLFFAPNERALNIWKPKPAFFIRIVQKADDFSKRVFRRLHGLPHPHNSA